MPQAAVQRSLPFLAPHATQAGCVLEAPALQVLLMAGDPGAVKTAPAWRRLAAVG